MGWRDSWEFSKVTPLVLNEAHETKGLYAETSSVGFTATGLVWETTSVWTDRESMSRFYRSGAHEKQMAAWSRAHNPDGDLEFGARRVFVPAEDVPKVGSREQAMEFIRAIKNDAYYDVGRRV